MSLVHASIIPNSSAALKNEDIHAALRELEGEIYFMQPDSILLLSHESNAVRPGAYIHVGENVAIETSHNGVLQFKTDTELAMHCKTAVNRSGFDHTTITTLDPLPASTGDVFELLTAHLQTIPLVDVRITPFEGDYGVPEAEHFGYVIGSELNRTNKRVAVVMMSSFSDAHNEASLYTFTQKGLTEQALQRALASLSDSARTINAKTYSLLTVFSYLLQSASTRHTILQSTVIDTTGYLVVNTTTQ